jgi:3,4-dihydroxy 2-butanone 4-phosphate synthase / GTP cyclohydrolase II
VAAPLAHSERAEAAVVADLRRLADRHGIPLPQLAELAGRRPAPPPPQRVVETTIPTPWGSFRAVGYRGAEGEEHVALTLGRLERGGAVPVHLHVECGPGAGLLGRWCACGARLREALDTVSAAGRGCVVYLRERPAGAPPACCALLASAAEPAVPPACAPDYAAGASILLDLGIAAARLLAPDDRQRRALARQGIRVARARTAAAAGSR